MSDDCKAVKVSLTQATFISGLKFNMKFYYHKIKNLLRALKRKFCFTKQTESKPKIEMTQFEKNKKAANFLIVNDKNNYDCEIRNTYNSYTGNLQIEIMKKKKEYIIPYWILHLPPEESIKKIEDIIGSKRDEMD